MTLLFCIFGTAWIASGIALTASIVRHSGWPDFETWDGYAIDFKNSLGLIVLCLIVSPFIWLWKWREDRARAKEAGNGR